jgi:drug/metabolite transporter (DMT)-like permease
LAHDAQARSRSRGTGVTEEETVHARPYIYLIVAALLFGALFPLNKMAAEAGVPPLAYAFWQSAGSGLALLFCATAVGHRIPGGRVALTFYLMVGALGLGLPIALLVFAAPHLPANLVTLVLALSPPLTFLFSVLVRVQRFRWLGLVGVGLGFSGILLLIGPKNAVISGSEATGWFLLCLLAPCLFAMANVAANMLRPPAATSAPLAAGIQLGSAAGLLPLCVTAGQIGWMPRGLGMGELALALAILIFFAFIWLFLEIIRLSGAIFFAQFNYLAVMAGLLWSWLIFGEAVPASLWAALALTTLGVMVLSYALRRQPAPIPTIR